MPCRATRRARDAVCSRRILRDTDIIFLIDAVYALPALASFHARDVRDRLSSSSNISAAITFALNSSASPATRERKLRLTVAIPIRPSSVLKTTIFSTKSREWRWRRIYDAKRKFSNSRHTFNTVAQVALLQGLQVDRVSSFDFFSFRDIFCIRLNQCYENWSTNLKESIDSTYFFLLNKLFSYSWGADRTKVASVFFVQINWFD